MTEENFGKLALGLTDYAPCTASAVIEILKSSKIAIRGKNVVVVGRSELVGLPLFHMLLNKNATVTICHSKTRNLIDYTKQADILIVAVGKKDLITPDMIKDNVVIIDVGINRFDGKLYGDVSNDCISKASLKTPVPGGVGPMTVISLMENVYLANNLQENIR